MQLIRRLSITIPGVRPAVFGPDLVSDLQELRGFRHVVRHAYDLSLKKDKLVPLLDAAQRVATLAPAACAVDCARAKASCDLRVYCSCMVAQPKASDMPRPKPLRACSSAFALGVFCHSDRGPARRLGGRRATRARACDPLR